MPRGIPSSAAPTFPQAATTATPPVKPERLDQPLRWRRPRRVFVNSMSDLFHKDVPGDYLAEIFAVMALAERHQFQVLTKRPQLMAHRLNNDAWLDDVDTARLRRQPLSLMPDWPRPNIWLGTSIESDSYTFRADHLRDTPAAVRWLSLEPLLGPLPSLDLTDIDWVVVGGESGPRARPMHPDWARDIRDRCVDAGVPYFHKQNGEYLAATIFDAERFVGGRAFDHPNGGRQAAALRPTSGRRPEWRSMRPGDVTAGLVMLDETTMAVKVGKRRAGRELDGRVWDEYPEVSAW
jgi:protein gp37